MRIRVFFIVGSRADVFSDRLFVLGADLALPRPSERSSRQRRIEAFRSDQIADSRPSTQPCPAPDAVAIGRDAGVRLRDTHEF